MGTGLLCASWDAAPLVPAVPRCRSGCCPSASAAALGTAPGLLHPFLTLRPASAALVLPCSTRAVPAGHLDSAAARPRCLPRLPGKRCMGWAQQQRNWLPQAACSLGETAMGLTGSGLGWHLFPCCCQTRGTHTPLAACCPAGLGHAGAGCRQPRAGPRAVQVRSQGGPQERAVVAGERRCTLLQLCCVRAAAGPRKARVCTAVQRMPATGMLSLNSLAHLLVQPRTAGVGPDGGGRGLCAACRRAALLQHAGGRAALAAGAWFRRLTAAGSSGSAGAVGNEAWVVWRRLRRPLVWCEWGAVHITS